MEKNIINIAVKKKSGTEKNIVGDGGWTHERGFGVQHHNH